MLIPKEIIRPGTYWYTDAETNQPKRLDATPGFVKHLYDQGNKMRQAGLSIPIPLEHQLDNKPMTPAERQAHNLLHNTGWVDSYLLDEHNVLFGLCEFDDKKYPDLLASLPTTIRYTSPWITNFMDGNGTQWNGVIGHLALTSRPRITKQQPFPDIAAALSLSGVASPLPPGAAPGPGIFLSPAGRLVTNKEKNIEMPARPLAFSVWSGITLAAPPPVAKKEKPAATEGKGEADPAGGGKPPAEPLVEEGPPGASKDALKKMGLLDVAKDLLSALFDVELPEEADEKTLLQHLVKALMERIKSQKGEQDMDPNNPNPQNKPAGQNGNTPAGGASPVVQETPPLYMSLEEVAKITDPFQKRMAEVILSLQSSLDVEKKRGVALATNTLAEAKKVRDARIVALSARLPMKAREKLTAHAASVNLSLTDDGKVFDPMEAFLTLLEESTVNIPILLSMQAQGLAPTAPVQEEPQPRDMEPGRLTEERRQEIVEEQCRNTGLPRRESA